MKILHTADWHIGNFPGPEREGKNLRAEDTGMCINYLHDIALLKKPDVILFSGDMFHQARVWADRGLSEVKTAIQALEALSEICPIVVMRGTPNHDGVEQFEMLKAHFSGNDSVHVITEPTVLPLKSYSKNSCAINVAVLPGFDRGVFRAKFPGLSKEEENQVFTEELSKIVLGLRAQCRPGMKSVLMSHYTVPGCNTESGQTQFFAQFEPVLLPEALDAAAFDLVTLGHIHRPQQVVSCQNTFYSGAINALNFNDEDQKRGFYIHDLDKGAHTFYETPARGFCTIKLDCDEIQRYNTTGSLSLAKCAEAQDRIVRVLYSCSDEQNKALNRARMERDLLEAFGAFWVAEISPEKIEIGTDKDELSEKTDPEKNLILYLSDKTIPADIGEIVEAARPIIATAVADSMSAQYAGAFIPLSIEVKNYRNYAEEQFDFTDVSFCTINGKNGAGKSSLFMDAILDCLFEEPREGDLTGWIRADEAARSGSICFTFLIGEHKFRVTRTRTKSGKATLNIAEWNGGEWQDRSSERYKDTQQTIESIIGMDSLTFRSCALIMQDQYGLFLQANKEDRMTILGNLLGLGIYGGMEQITRNRLSDNNRQIAQLKTEMATLAKDTVDEEALKTNYVHAQADADNGKKALDNVLLHKENISLRLTAKRESADKAAAIASSIQDAERKKAVLTQNMQVQQSIINEANSITAQEADILAGVADHKAFTEREKELSEQLAAAKATLQAFTGKESQLNAMKANLKVLQGNLNIAQTQAVEVTQKLQAAWSCQVAAKEFEELQAEISLEEQRTREQMEASSRFAAARDEYIKLKSACDVEAMQRKATVELYQSKANMLTDSQCIDPDRATCRFLADALDARNQLTTYLPACTQWKNEQLAILANHKKTVDDLSAELTKINYDPQKLRMLRANSDHLRHSAEEFKKISLYEDLVRQNQERIAQLDESIAAENVRIQALTNDLSDVTIYQRKVENLNQQLMAVRSELSALAAWLEKEKQLPLANERATTAKARLIELSEDFAALGVTMATLLRDHERISAEAAGVDDLQAQLNEASETVTKYQAALNQLHSSIGALFQRLDQIATKKEEIAKKQKAVNTLAKNAAILETLKAAFSQDGIPHNIIRSMLPMLTTTANTILGQMTGGKMGMEFITDKVLKSNSKKEVPTLDIIINEYGKDSLPYMSKSGGEKVKASLSAILSLAEIKSSQAGIQLGMLFIDEPPFLDADGIQAYCDALETIQKRYSGLKVMAITHDPTMKARFPQSIDIIKTPEGSRVEVA